MSLKKIVILAVLCMFAALLAGCTSNDSTRTTIHEMTGPAPGGEAPAGNMTRPSDGMNQTPPGERGQPPEAMNMTPGGSFQPPEGGMGAPDGQFRQPTGMNGTPQAPGGMQGGMQPPSPPGT